MTESTPPRARYGDWRDDIAADFPTSGPIPAHPWVAHPDALGLLVDAGRMTADDANREVARIAGNLGLAHPEDMVAILEGEGWETDSDDSQALTEYVDYVVEPYLNALISGYRGDDSSGFHVVAGWDGDVGGFGLWAVDVEGDYIDPDDYPDDWRQ